MANWWQSIRERALQIKDNLDGWAKDVFLVVVVILVGISAFGLGRLSAQESGKPAIQAYERPQEAREATAAAVVATEPIAAGGEVVASVNGSKYHYPWCSGAKRMKEANKIWFASIEEARAAGYEPAKNCKGLK